MVSVFDMLKNTSIWNSTLISLTACELMATKEKNLGRIIIMPRNKTKCQKLWTLRQKSRSAEVAWNSSLVLVIDYFTWGEWAIGPMGTDEKNGKSDWSDKTGKENRLDLRKSTNSPETGSHPRIVHIPILVVTCPSPASQFGINQFWLFL